ncbi:hypothetical protein ELQ35_20590 [Peribacillus cavernae]|uniref:Uncharacterized protein n=1 Tax=Peribacillus cavernae TaxID=1674310 RepID=A0A433HA75_9BACI|nr:hypothetical protein [Peribacillus cavernae]MDQ0219761.1 hypothetical protein [Peribacillus cavernae]RUQ25178.1 hypothetical protein ELQ35_20590 [Peribacillus cavernae]
MSYSLTAEELILSLILVGGAEAAYSIKEETFGEISEDELEHRLDSATNGLLSKDLLTIQQNQEILETEFQQFLLQLTKTPRVLRCQIATDEGMTNTSLYCGVDFTVQQSTYNNRVHKLFKEVSDSKICGLMDLSHSNKHAEAFTIEESLFEIIIDKLLHNTELTEADIVHYPSDFIHALKERHGKLNTLFDYKLTEDKVGIDTFLYVTDAEQTWIIQEDNDQTLSIRPFSFNLLFQSV